MWLAINKAMKGILLAGGQGTRLYPATHSICKQLLPVYDKPMIYYPLCTLMLAGIREMMVITNPHELHLFQDLLGKGSQWGIEICYKTQESPGGIAEAFLLGEEFIEKKPVSLILGDNIVYGQGIAHQLQNITHNLREGATIFGYYVRDPERYGVVNFDEKGHATEIVEKPEAPTSHYAVIGLYFYDEHVCELAHDLKPSVRGELEITDINQYYLQQGNLTVERLGRGVAWLDTGTHESLLEAANFIQVLEKRQGLKLACPEEVAWRMGYIDDNQFERLAQPLIKSGYGSYLMDMLKR